MHIIEIILIINLFFIFTLIFFEYKKPGETLAWILVFIFIPWLGFLAYIFLGGVISIKISYWFRTKLLSDNYTSKLNQQIKNSTLLINSQNNHNLEKYISIINCNMNYNNSLFSSNNNAKVFTSGMEKYKKLFTDIRDAKESIHIEYYTIQNDIIGKGFMKLLEQKAKEGVEIRIIFDGISNKILYRKSFKYIKQNKGEIHNFRFLAFNTNLKNHRKIVIIDGKIAYIGGMNIGKKYVNLHKSKTPWRDTHIRILGNSVSILQYYFLKDWLYLSRENKIKHLLNNIEKYFPENNIDNELPMQIITNCIENKEENIKMCYLKLICSATKSIWIQTPSIIPDDTILDVLKMAGSSGLDVRIMIPIISSNCLLKYMSNYYIRKLIKHNIKIYQYKGYLHAKTLIVDGLTTCIGSVNLDSRNLGINNEICSIFYSRKFSQNHQDIFKNDLLNSQELDYKIFATPSIKVNLIEAFLRIFSPLM